jgi:hypothetical protein
MRTVRLVLLLSTLVSVLPAAVADARETGFDPRVITFGDTRDQIKSTPIEQRPYRPLHVYGNSVRRRTHRAAPSGPRSSGQR